MRRALLRFLLFLGLALIPLTAGEWYVRQLPNPARSKHQYLTRHSRTVRTLVLGSSHTYYGLSPRALGPGAYSLAQVSQTYDMDCRLLRHYPFPALRNVILPLSYFSLYERTLSSSLHHLATRYYLYMDLPRRHLLDPDAFECTDFPAFIEKLTSLWRPRRMLWDAWGHGLEYTLASRPQPWDNGRERAAANTYAAAPTEQLHLRHIARFCRQRGVRLILLTTPVSPHFIANEDARQRRATDSVCRRLLAEYPEIVRLDYARHPAFRDRDFYDADHLNTQGAERLSRMVRKWLLK